MMLALRLGRTLAELGATMSSAEFSLWAELYRLDRWGQKSVDEMFDYRTGLICATTANFAGKSLAEHAGPAKPQDFMPHFQPAPAEEPDPVTFFKAVATSKQFERKE